MAQPGSVAVEGDPGNDDQIDLVDGDAALALAAQFGPGLEDLIASAGQLVHALQSKQLQPAVAAIGNHDLFALGQCRGQKVLGADFGSDVDVKQDRPGGRVLGQFGQRTADEPAQLVLAGLRRRLARAHSRIDCLNVTSDRSASSFIASFPNLPAVCTCRQSAQRTNR